MKSLIGMDRGIKGWKMAKKGKTMSLFVLRLCLDS